MLKIRKAPLATHMHNMDNMERQYYTQYSSQLD